MTYSMWWICDVLWGALADTFSPETLTPLCITCVPIVYNFMHYNGAHGWESFAFTNLDEDYPHLGACV